MTYRGTVSRGGPADVRELPALTVAKVSVGPMDNDAYLLSCRATGERLLVDAADDAGTLLALLDDNGSPRLEHLVTTHRHQDHWQALAEVVRATGARTYAGSPDADGLPVQVDVRLVDGDVVQVGEVPLQVIALVGHTPGSVALRYDDPQGHPHLLTGDSLFPGGPGRTVSRADFTSLMDDLEAKVFGQLTDDTWFYPGHGDDSTLGEQRPHLTEWRERGW